MSPRIEIAGGAAENEAAAIVAAIQAVIAEEEDQARRARRGSRWRPELPVFQPGSWGVPRPAEADDDE